MGTVSSEKDLEIAENPAFFFERAQAYLLTAQQLQERAEQHAQTLGQTDTSLDKKNFCERELIAARDRIAEIAWFADDLCQEAAHIGHRDPLFQHAARTSQTAAERIECIYQMSQQATIHESDLVDFFDEDGASEHSGEGAALSEASQPLSAAKPVSEHWQRACHTLVEIQNRVTATFHVRLEQWETANACLATRLVWMHADCGDQAAAEPETIHIHGAIGRYILHFWWGDAPIALNLPHEHPLAMAIRAVLAQTNPAPPTLPESLLPQVLDTIHAIAKQACGLRALQADAQADNPLFLGHFNGFLDIWFPEYPERFRTSAENREILSQVHQFFSQFNQLSATRYPRPIEAILATILRRLERLAHKITTRSPEHPHAYRNVYKEIDQVLSSSIKYLQEQPPMFSDIIRIYRTASKPEALEPFFDALAQWIDELNTRIPYASSEPDPFSGDLF